MRTEAVIVGTGASTPLAVGITESSFLLRTGLTAITSGALTDSEGEPVTLCFDPTLDPEASAADRALSLAKGALKEALRPIVGTIGRPDHAPLSQLRTKFIVCVDAVAEEQARMELATAVGQLQITASELGINAPASPVARGAAGAAFALPEALTQLNQNQIDLIVLGGMHSDHDAVRIGALEAAGRLFTPSNMDALVPGESAAWVVLCREDLAHRARLASLSRLFQLGSGVESARNDNDESAYRATALTAAVRTAAGDLGSTKVGFGYCDHTFETFRIKEWQAMMTRTHRIWGAPLTIDSPGQRIGHLGAAALPLFAALATEAFVRGHAPANVAMCTAGSDAGERGALLVGAP